MMSIRSLFSMLLALTLVNGSHAGFFSCDATDMYSKECVDLTQPPFIVKLFNIFSGNSCEDYTMKSLAAADRCCLSGPEDLPGECQCPKAAEDTESKGYQKFVKGMYGDDTEEGWCSKVQSACNSNA